MLFGFDATLVFVLNLVGTFAFALSGAMAGVRARLDVFGVLVLAGSVGLAGGIVRDLLIGRPPATFRDERYLFVAVAAGVLACLAHPLLGRLERHVDVFDAAGLAVFCVTGTATAIHFEVDGPAAVLLGAITAIGGGVLRDLFVGEPPTVLRDELYAIPALVGATIVAAPYVHGNHQLLWPILGAATCFTLRLLGIRYRLDLPRPSDWFGAGAR
ncbi:MAG: hypothetical protein JWN72_2089 [Thermoleophilia bacterium]|nr:hypothetical protein [Thermoleophilia bacterium]